MTHQEQASFWGITFDYVTSTSDRHPAAEECAPLGPVFVSNLVPAEVKGYFKLDWVGTLTPDDIVNSAVVLQRLGSIAEMPEWPEHEQLR